jgi:tagaturonate reductase
MSGRIVQFGTSRFLQAHADLFVHEVREAGQPAGPITVVKTTEGGDRAGRVAGFRRAGGFPVQIRGYRAGALIDQRVMVRSVDQAFDAHADWPAVTDHFAKDAEIAMSNVGDRGYDVAEEDRVFDPSSAKIPVSFPGKLLALLGARHRAGGRPLLFLPTELIASNGRILSCLVADLARAWGMSAAFQEWLASSVVFADGLVDRIVSEDIEPIGAVAEPYALWAIRRGNFDPPFTHPAIVMTDNLEPFERLKLHILNLGHTVLAEEWTRRSRPADETVVRFLSDAAVALRLTDIFASEVVPGFAARGMGDAAAAYVRTTLERFRNPFLQHRIADIANNHATKVARRIQAFMDWVHERDPSLRMPHLAAIAQTYR